MTCYINNTFPAANLTWFVTGKRVRHSLITTWYVSTCPNKQSVDQYKIKVLVFSMLLKYWSFSISTQSEKYWISTSIKAPWHLKAPLSDDSRMILRWFWPTTTGSYCKWIWEDPRQPILSFKADRLGAKACTGHLVLYKLPYLQQSNVAVPFMTQGQDHEADQMFLKLSYDSWSRPRKPSC